MADYLPIRDYAVIGNGRSAALVSSHGSIDWCCLPRFDSPAVFCRILDAQRGGSFRVAPAGRCSITRRYVPGSNALETTFTTAYGRARMTDAMLTGVAAGSQDDCTIIVRRVEGLAGRLQLEVDLNPTFEYASTPAQLSLQGTQGIAVGRSEALRLACPGEVTHTDDGLHSDISLVAGDRCVISLSHTPSADPPPVLRFDALEEAVAATISAERRWLDRCNYAGPHADLVRRSALVLKLLTHEPTGGIVAAPTTSLPEAIGGGRNWDYRYTWVRDAAWALDGLMSLGYHDEAMSFWKWLEQRGVGSGGSLAVLYTVAGESAPSERILDHFEGYRGSRPVRIGNAAGSQTQLDVFGEVVGAIFSCSELMPTMRPLRAGLWRLVTAMADAAAQKWRQPDHGMWEIRGEPRHFLSSKLHCWVALDRALRLAERDGLTGPLRRWRAERAAVSEAILREGYDPVAAGGAFVQAFGSAELDSSALLLPLVGFLPANDPRVRATVDAILQRLVEGGLLRRYSGSDGVEGDEGVFLLCSLWLVENLALLGDRDGAGALLDRVANCANDVGLMSEEFDPLTGALLGNFPQALTHLALIRAATR